MRSIFHSCLLTITVVICFVSTMQRAAAQTSPVVYVLAAAGDGGSTESRHLLLLRRFGGSDVSVSSVGQITGMVEPGEVVQVVDFRPATGQLFGVSSHNRLYTISTEDAAAVPVSSATFRSADSTTVTSGFDFDTVVDRAWLVDSASDDVGARRLVQLDPTTGEIEGTPVVLSYADGDRNTGRIPSVNALAFANNISGAASSALYGIDSVTDALIRFGSPDTARLTTIGSLGVDASAVAGFDVTSETGVGYAALTTGAGTNLYTIDLITGTASYIAPIRRDVDGQSLTIIDIAAALSVHSGIVISEFRTRGPGGASDEFVELANLTDVPVTISTADRSGGWTLFAPRNFNGLAGGVRLSLIPEGTVIPARGHFLLSSRSGYTLAAYPAGADAEGHSTTAFPDSVLITDIADNTGVALFRSAFDLSRSSRLDAVGFRDNALATPGYREGVGIEPVMPQDVEHSYVRRVTGGRIQDTDDNAHDFVLVSPVGNAFGAGRVMPGAPGPENTTSPIVPAAGALRVELLDPSQPFGSEPNLVLGAAEQNAPAGTLLVRRRVTNTSARAISRLRFRIVAISTGGADTGKTSGAARNALRQRSRVLLGDLRVIGSSPSETLVRGLSVTLLGTVLEQPPAQPQGGGINSSLGVLAITTDEPLASGATVYVEFKLGVRRVGGVRFEVVAEALP